MKVVFTALLLAALFTANVPASQAPTIGVTFSCTPAGADCTEFMRLVSEGLGYPGTGGRMAFIQQQTLRHLHRVGEVQRKHEDTKAAADSAEASFRSKYPVP